MHPRGLTDNESIDHRPLFQGSPYPYLVLSLDLRIIEVNPAYLALVGATREQLVGQFVFDALPSPGRDASLELRDSFRQVIELEKPHTIPFIHYAVSFDIEPRERFWSVTNAPLFDARGTLIGILNCPIEVKRFTGDSGSGGADSQYEMANTPGVDAVRVNQYLEGERRRFRQLMQQAPGFVAVGRGPHHVFELANNAYYQLVGHRDILGKPVRQALPELDGQGFYELLDHVYESGQPFIGRAMPIQVQAEPHAALVERYIDFIYQPIVDEEGKISGIFVQGHDVTEAHELSLTVSYQAAHDALTGLANRREFEIQLADAVADAVDGRGPHSLIYIDLDQFKVVNDTSGHAAGDELLRRVSMHLLGAVSSSDTVARLGGDEFGILLRNRDVEAAEALAEQYRQVIDDINFSWQHRVFGCSASLGVITFDADIGGVDAVLGAADAACFMAKERGRNRVQIHHQSDDDIVARRREMDWVSRLREALANKRFVLFAQRIVPTSRSVPDPGTRVELLLRLVDVDGSLVPPMAFLPAAERFGLMPAIDRMVIHEVFQALSGLPIAVRERIDVSINLSAHTLGDNWLLPFIYERMRDDRSIASRVCFEITETAALHNLSRTTDLILELKALGFRFALDDFGSGMSSLSYLKQLPVDYLKLDGAFIRQITTSPADAAIVEAMARVASVMGIRTVAEYVDTEATRTLLEQLNIDYVQGFCVHVPEPFQDLLNRQLQGHCPATEGGYSSLVP